MDLNDLLKDAKNSPSYEFNRKLNKLVRENPRYRNLGEKNKGVIKNLIKKYKPYLRKGLGVSGDTVRRDMYKLHQDRIKLDLTEEDLDDIKEIADAFRK